MQSIRNKKRKIKNYLKCFRILINISKRKLSIKANQTHLDLNLKLKIFKKTFNKTMINKKLTKRNKSTSN